MPTSEYHKILCYILKIVRVMKDMTEIVFTIWSGKHLYLLHSSVTSVLCRAMIFSLSNNLIVFFECCFQLSSFLNWKNCESHDVKKKRLPINCSTSRSTCFSTLADAPKQTYYTRDAVKSIISKLIYIVRRFKSVY